MQYCPTVVAMLPPPARSSNGDEGTRSVRTRCPGVADSRPMSRRQGGAVAMALLVLAFTASCNSSQPDAAGTDPSAAATAPPTSVDRPAGPVADLGEELTGGNGVFVAATSPT